MERTAIVRRNDSRRSPITAGSRCNRTARPSPPASNTRGSTPRSLIAHVPETGSVRRVQHAVRRFREPPIDGAVISGRHRLTRQRRFVLALNPAIEVPVIDDQRVQNTFAGDLQRAVPGGRARTAAVFGTLIERALSARRDPPVVYTAARFPADRAPSKMSSRSIGAEPTTSMISLDGVIGDPGDVAHHQLGNGCGRRRWAGQIRIALEQIGVLWAV